LLLERRALTPSILATHITFLVVRMLTGKQFVIGRPTLGLEAIENQRRVVTIPTGAIVKVLSGPSQTGDNGTVSVEWESRTLAMFAIDLDARGREIADSVSA
jgi:hypothetical protein